MVESSSGAEQVILFFIAEAVTKMGGTVLEKRFSHILTSDCRVLIQWHGWFVYLRRIMVLCTYMFHQLNLHVMVERTSIIYAFNYVL